MACGYAKFTGRLGVCLATSGPGGLHLLNGLYDAKLDGQPVLAITGMPYHDMLGTHAQQDVELDKVFADVAKYNVRVMGATHVENVAHLACRTALMYRGVSHITFPVDLQDQPLDGTRSKRNIEGHASEVLAFSARLPSDGDLAQAADVLNSGRKVVILAGRGALGASAELEQIADRLGAPIAKALLGKAAVPDDSPYTTGTIGLLGTRPSQEAMEECDTLLMVGTSFPYLEFLPRPGQARGVQIELDPMRIGLRYPVEVGLVGDSARTLRALLPLLGRKDDRRFPRDRSRSPNGARPAGRGAGRAAARGRAVRAHVRPGPGHARVAHPGRDARQQLVRCALGRCGARGGQRGIARGPDVRRAPPARWTQLLRRVPGRSARPVSKTG